MGFFTAYVKHKDNNESKKLTRTIYKIDFYNGYTNARLGSMYLYDKAEFEAIKQDISVYLGQDHMLVTKDGVVNLKFFGYVEFSESEEEYDENTENCD